MSRSSPFQTVTRRLVLVEEIAAAPPDALHSLSLSCPHHDPARPMAPIGETASACGDALVLYACPAPGCRYREGWGRDARTGRPRRMIHGFDESRR